MARTWFLTVDFLAPLERATPLETLAVRAVAPVPHGTTVGTAGGSCGCQRHGGLELEVPSIAFVQRDDEFRVPEVVAEPIKTQSIAGFVETRDLNRETQVVAGLMHREEIEHRIVPTVVGEQDKEWKFDRGGE